MAEHHIERQFETVDSAEQPLERLLEFYRANGYETTDDEADDLSDGLRLVRGEPGIGWWTSDMSKLRTTLEIRRRDDTIDLRYVVDVTGQILTDDDREFWERELEAARQHLAGLGEFPRDLRDLEANRAKNIHHSMLSRGIWGGIIVFVVIAFLRILGMF